MKYQEILDECGKILTKQKVELKDGAASIVDPYKLALKLKVVDLAFNTLMKHIKEFEAEMALQKDKTKVPIQTTINLLYLYESFLFQIVVAMDFWAQFIGNIPGFRKGDTSFKEHKENVLKLKDKVYAKYVKEMEWFDKMKYYRNRITHKEMSVFPFDEKRGGFISASLYPQKRKFSEKIPLLRDTCKEFYDNSIEYRDFVFKHFK